MVSPEVHVFSLRRIMRFWDLVISLVTYKDMQDLLAETSPCVPGQ